MEKVIITSQNLLRQYYNDLATHVLENELMKDNETDYKEYELLYAYINVCIARLQETEECLKEFDKTIGVKLTEEQKKELIPYRPVEEIIG